MSSIIRFFFKIYFRIGFFFYFKKKTVFGQENIPKKGAILFVTNHPNALLDPLLIATSCRRNTHFLTRAGVFKKKLIIKLFEIVQMIPIYRIRDGWNNLSKNEEIFQKCFTILNNKEALFIVPEGSHSITRKIRPLSKGFTRILFGAFDKNSDLNIEIVPIGLNFDSILNYPSSVSIYYGKPINANKYYDKNDLSTSTNELKKVVRNEMKKLTTHIDSPEKYDDILATLKANNANFTKPYEVNNMIKNIDVLNTKTTAIKPKTKRSLFYYLVALNSIIPLFIWKKIRKKIKELEFVSTFRFAILITLFPVFYILQSTVIKHFYGENIAVIYFVTSLFLGLFLTKFSKVNLY